MGLSFYLAVKQERRTRRRRRTQDSKNWVAPEIPQDLLIEILARLPAKSVLRFKCISKFWSSFFCSRYFCNRFLMVPYPSQPRLYMSLLDLYDYSKALLLSSAPSTCSSPSSLAFDQDLTIRKMGGFFMRILRGFICFAIYLKARIYNPNTGQLVILPAIDSKIVAEEDRYNIYYFLCHDPVSDQYKLLCTITLVRIKDLEKFRTEHWVFVIEAGGSWKRVAKEFHPHLPADLELNLNGVLYYLAWTDIHTCVLVSFDTRSEEFNMIKVPRKPGDIGPSLKKRVSQIEYGGKIAVFEFTHLKETGTMDLWVVEDWRKKEWSRKTLVLQPSQMQLVIDNRLTPKGTSLKDKVILIPEKLTSPFYFLCYNLQNNDLKKVEIKGIPDRWFSKHESTLYFDMEFMDSNGSINYLET